MKKTDRSRFAVVIGSTAELFNRHLTEAAMELWWNALSDLELDQIEQGVSRHLRDSDRGKFMPTPADVRYFCGFRHPTGSIAWGEVLDTMESVGAYRTVLFADGVVNAVIRDMGGWAGVCHRQSTDENPAWVQKDFEKRYEEYRQSNRVSQQALIGLHDEHNVKFGYLEYVQKQPVYIQSAQQIPVPALVARNQLAIEGASETEQDGTLAKIEGGI